MNLHVIDVVEDDLAVDLTQDDAQDDAMDDIDFDFQLDDVLDVDVDVDILDVDILDVDILDVDIDGDFTRSEQDALYDSILKGEWCLKPVRGEDGEMRYTLKMLK